MKGKSRQNIIVTAALIFLTAVFSLLNPNFAGKYNIISMVQSLTPYALMALGVSLPIASGGIDLSAGTVLIASSVISGKLLSLGLIPLPAVIPLMILTGCFFGLMNGILVAFFRLPSFIATLGTMMISKGLSALIVRDPNIFFPGDTWFNKVFSNSGNFPPGILWIILFSLLSMLFIYKTRTGRYILAAGSNPEAAELSGIDVKKYRLIAFLLSGAAAGMAAVFRSAAFPTVAAGSGTGMELDAIAGVYIGGTSPEGGSVSVAGTVIGSAMLVVIRSGLNFALARYAPSLNGTYITYVLTGIIVISAVFTDIMKKQLKGER